MRRHHNRYEREVRLSLALVALVSAACLALASPAVAGVPTHVYKPGLDVTGFSRACGVAIDGKGDMYVASAGESTIQVLDPERKLLTSIADANEPCGLAVDSKGQLYATDTKTGDVVKYTPNTYPFAGTLVYGASSTIVASGKAKGISVDARDDRLYVAEGDRIAVYTPGGSFEENIAEGELSDATGVAVYTHVGTVSANNEGKLIEEHAERYLLIAESSTSRLRLYRGQKFWAVSEGTQFAVPQLVRTIEGVDQDYSPQTPDQALGLDSEAYVVADPGNEGLGLNCKPVAEQACSAGHFFVYDALHGVVDEFDATGHYVTQVELEAADPSFADPHPPAIAVDRSGGVLDGTVYVGDGSGLGAMLLAYAPLAAPSRPESPTLSHVLEKTQAVTVDSVGDVYVAAGTKIHVYDSGGSQITEFEDSEGAQDMSVDSTGKLYAADSGPTGSVGQEKVTYYTPSAYPPISGVQYVRHEPAIAKKSDLPQYGNTGGNASNVAVNSANDHVFVGGAQAMIELDSAAKGSTVLNPEFGGELQYITSLAVYGPTGDVYVGINPGMVFILDPAGKRVAEITGTGSPGGSFFERKLFSPTIAVDQFNGHFLAFGNGAGVAEEFDASGGFIAEFGKFTENISRPYRAALDNSSGPNRGDLYIAFDDPSPGTYDVTASGPLAYGEPPAAVTGATDGLGAGGATLHGTVDPRGFDIEACRFEYVTEAGFQAKGFTGAPTAECTPNAAGIGKGTGAVAVHAALTGLGAQERYRFRLVAENKYGASDGETGLFGLPVVSGSLAVPVGYTEVTLRASVDPSGVDTSYHFEYGPGEEYGESTPSGGLSGTAGSGEVRADVAGLVEGQLYHFRLVAESEAGIVDGSDATFTTLARRPIEDCANKEYRTGPSASLPDCRAYELVTPAETRGANPVAANVGSAGAGFSNWLVVQDGPVAGERLTFFTYATLPGYDGNGVVDGYRTERAEGAHPPVGWQTSLFSPTFVQADPGDQPAQHGVSADEMYSFWKVGPTEAIEGGLAAGVYLRTPTGFEVAGQGSMGSDLHAESRYVSAGGRHVIFTSTAQLESDAPQEGTRAVYDRMAGSTGAQVVSVKPDGTPFEEGQDAAYVEASEDAASVVFEVGGVLYLHREGETFEIAQAPSSFAGLSSNGERVLYAATGSTSSPAGLFACDAQSAGCAGPGSHAAVEIASDSKFAYVSPDASHVYLTSTKVLDEAEEGQEGSENLYVWDGKNVVFVAVLDPDDFTVGFGGHQEVSLGRWLEAVAAGPKSGLGKIPARTAADGEIFVFQSHARLTGYDNHGVGEIYRYDPSAVGGERLTCVSCDPSGAPPSTDAMLQVTVSVENTTLIANVTKDGKRVFFQSGDRLLPEDANHAADVYEWKADGVDGCARTGGCLALISFGQSEEASELYGMSADGHDVFFTTEDKLVPSDVTGSPSIYDARVGGGIPIAQEKAGCQGDACQGQPTPPPATFSPASVAGGPGNVVQETGKPASGTPRSLTPAQKLARALKACKRKPARKRHHCVAQVRKNYRAGAKKAAKSKNRRAGK
jgi:hypothetical protein